MTRETPRPTARDARGTLLTLMLAPFAFSTGAFVFAGLLDPMATDLGVSVSAAGQLQTAFAIACALGGPILAIATRRMEKRRLLVLVLAFLAVSNALSALAPRFEMLVLVRVVAGFVGALTLPLASTLAVASVADDRRPVALATVFAGNSMAFLVGVPAGSIIGSALGWSASFWFAACLCAVVAAVILLRVPAAHSPTPPAPGGFARMMRWPLTGPMTITLLGFAATFTTVGFIGPVITGLTGVTGSGIGLMQTLIGVGSLAGLALGARLAGLRAIWVLPALLGTICITQIAYWAGFEVAHVPGAGLAVTIVATAAGATALFAIAPIVQTRLALAAGPDATIAFALNGSMVFLGQGAGVALGGVALGLLGLPAVGLAGAILALLACGVALRLPTPSPEPAAAAS